MNLDWEKTKRSLPNMYVCMKYLFSHQTDPEEVQIAVQDMPKVQAHLTAQHPKQ